MRTYLGFDFGGTKLLVGEADENGNILRQKKYATGCKTQAEAVKVLLDAAQDYKETVGFVGTPCAAGVGIIGIVDHANGAWVAVSHDIVGPPVPLANMLSKVLHIPCAVDNDVRSAVTAELLLGMGRKTKDFIYLNVGTGLAAGFVIDGKILRGANVNAGEIGHMTIDMNDTTPCICGRRGCVENVVSGIGFTQQAQKYGLQDLLTQPGGRADVKKLFDRAEAGDEICARITNYGAKALSAVILNLVRTTDPEAVVYGGGILSDARFLKKVEDNLVPSVMRGVRYGLTPSVFDTNYAGLTGAVSLGMQIQKGENE